MNKRPNFPASKRIYLTNERTRFKPVLTMIKCGNQLREYEKQIHGDSAGTIQQLVPIAK